jgi:hypothetical protein
MLLFSVFVVLSGLPLAAQLKPVSLLSGLPRPVLCL